MATIRSMQEIVEDISVDTTFPTDFSISQDEITSELQTTDDDPLASRPLHYQNAQSKSHRPHPSASKGVAEQQLRLDLQKVNVQLKEKSIKFDNLKAEYIRKVDDLECKLDKSERENQLLKVQLHLQKDEMKHTRDELETKLASILTTQSALQATSVDIQRTLNNVVLTDDQYYHLRSHSEEGISLTDFIAMKLYEKEKEWKAENESLKLRVKSANDDLHKCKLLLEKCQDDLELERRNRYELEMKLQRSSVSYDDLKNQIHLGNFKIENYDKINRERDEYEQKHNDISKQFDLLQAVHQRISKERDEYSVELASAKQSVVLLKQDKEYFSKQVSELHNKLIVADERVVQLNEQLERAKQAREELYEKYIVSRDQYKSEYDEKLRTELEQIRLQTNAEIDRLRTNTRELYERENRGLREARDNALSEKDRALATERETYNKYEQLLQDFRQQQLTGDTKMSDAYNEVKIKTFEAERTQLLYEETLRTLKDSQISNEKLQKKFEVLTKEYYTLQTSMEKRVTELETVVNEKTVKLESYERLEQELDEVILQAADIENEDEAERVLFSYGYGANIPTTAKRRLKQSVHLARRVLQLERANTSLRKELERENEKSKQLAEEVRSTNKLLDDSHQPYHYLVESIRQRDIQINKMKQQLATYDQEHRQLQKEKNELSQTKNQLTLDLERLLNHKEEMSVMKQVVLNLSRNHNSLSLNEDRPSSTRSLTTMKKAMGPKRSVTRFEPAERDENIHKPQPTEFTVHKYPDRYSQTKQKIKDDPKFYSSLRRPTLPTDA